MPVDYSLADQILGLSFGKFDRPAASISFPKTGILASQISDLLDPAKNLPLVIPYNKGQLLASASVEMWHRSIHSFLLSVILTRSSPMWASINGYYASHFIMRAFGHSMGFFKSFTRKKAVQIVSQGGQFVVRLLENEPGEHAFYWKVVKGHPQFAANPLFRENRERDRNSDAAHRTFANYTDHVNSFIPLEFLPMEEVTENVQKISRIRRHSVTAPSREDYPDLFNVQILAYQRIVEFHDFLDQRITKNRFWRAHRRPAWCNNVMLFQIEDRGVETPSA